jgi:lipopolysaccharide transport system ATP-binding protein
MTTVISAENLSKIYRLGQINTGAFYNDLKVWWAKKRGKPNPFLRVGELDHRNRDGEEIWALRDVSFTVEQGEALGIIGRNGAGKSTLLKILSRVTAPTSGKVKVKGRVASLLEIGTGFHPDLTGRENIYLNGAILGMSRKEIERKFDEIVDFAEIAQFMDTPVKRYSSGMYVRLAFAVAAHLEPEILLVDEVLAVGDAAFQKKCLGKMGDVASEGRTVLFVSHNMGAIRNLCNKCMLIEKGTLTRYGESNDIIDAYLLEDSLSISSIRQFTKPKDYETWIESVKFFSDGKLNPYVKYGDDIYVEIEFKSTKSIRRPGVGLAIVNSRGENIINTNNIYLPSPEFPQGVTHGRVRYKLGKVPLMTGRYTLTLWLGENARANHQRIDRAISFEVMEYDAWGRNEMPTRHFSSLWWPTEFEFLE